MKFEPMYKTFQTPRLQIRPIRNEDADFILALVNSEGWLNYIGDRNIRDFDQAAAYITAILDTPKRFYSVIEVKPSLEPAGIVSFIFREEYEFPDLGFALLPRFEKKGYAEEASSGYLKEIFLEGLYPKVIAITKPENHKSVRLLEKLGFVYEATETKGDGVLSVYSIRRS